MEKKMIYAAALMLALSACQSKGRQAEKETASTEATATGKDTENVRSSDTPVWYEGETPFVFDFSEDYPVTDIRLSELADVSYLPLATSDSVLLRLRGKCSGNEYLLTDEYIYMVEGETALYVFRRDGSFVRCIEKRGGGPEEYPYISSFAVDEPNKEIFIQDGNTQGGRMLVYSLEGKFLRTFSNHADEIVILNDSLLVNFYDHYKEDYPYQVVRKSDGSVVCRLPVKQVDKKFVWGEYMAYGKLTTTPRGVLLAHLANDTIFELRKDLTLIPRFIDKSNYHTHYAQVHPTIEMPRYLMFYILRGQNNRYKTSIKERFYIYDKKERQIFQMKEYKDNDYWRLLDDYPHINNWNKAQNPHVAVRSRLVYSLMKGKGKHGSPELLRLLETLDEDDNPVLEIMEFHDVDKIE